MYSGVNLFQSVLFLVVVVVVLGIEPRFFTLRFIPTPLFYFILCVKSLMVTVVCQLMGFGICSGCWSGSRKYGLGVYIWSLTLFFLILLSFSAFWPPQTDLLCSTARFCLDNSALDLGDHKLKPFKMWVKLSPSWKWNQTKPLFLSFWVFKTLSRSGTICYWLIQGLTKPLNWPDWAQTCDFPVSASQSAWIQAWTTRLHSVFLIAKYQLSSSLQLFIYFIYLC